MRERGRQRSLHEAADETFLEQVLVVQEAMEVVN